MPDDFASFGRIVNNITMAMPHSGIVAAAKDPKNRILQPDSLDVRGPRSHPLDIAYRQV